MARDEVYQQEYQHLLQALKGTVEGLLISQVSNVWNIYGGLSRLQKAMERIFKHGCRVFNHHGDPDCWVFIQGLSWLRPSLALSPLFSSEVEDSQQLEDRASVWLHYSLENHTLSQKLSWLLSDREHLYSCFERFAFLCQEAYGEATLLCLQAVEQNRPPLLTEINPSLVSSLREPHCAKLPRPLSSLDVSLTTPPPDEAGLTSKVWHNCVENYLTTWKHTVFKKSHRRCSSFPEMQYNLWRSGRSELGSSAKTSDDSHLTLSSHSCIRVEESGETVPSSVDNTSSSNTARENAQCVGTSIATVKNVERDSVCLRRGDGRSESHKWDMRIKPWGSLPSLVQSVVQADGRERTLLKHTPLNRVHSLPTTPSRRMPLVEKLLPVMSPELSPSILAVDYLLELSDTSGSSSLSKNLGKQRSPSARNRGRCSTIKAAKSSSNGNTISLLLRRPSLDCADGSNGSSDTLNPETGNISDESTDLKHPAQTEARSCVRPSKLKLVTTTWDEKDGSHSAGDSGIDLRKCRGLAASSATDSAGELGQATLAVENSVHSLVKKKSFIEDGGSSVLPMATGFFPRPIEGQSLESFLSSGDFSRPSAELDRENAHFSISEAMIAAIEQVKCNRQLRMAIEEGDGEESDEEINHLKQRIRLRRRQRQEEKQRHLWGVAMLSDGKTDRLSVSMASLYSEADLSKHHHAISPRGNCDGPLTESVVSAEGVALCLIRQFSDKQLPRASDLQWLVSEQDAPQQLLPMPTSWPVSPDEAEDTDTCQAMPLRGTVEWAPPRPQVIFTPHAALPRRVLMEKQNYRCAGCGMKVAPEYAHRFRYCEYLGRYFCTGCHTGQLAVIPGKILTKWDFSRYPVSTFSYRLLDQMMCDPLFRVGDLNSGLYRRAKQLERVYHCRLHLYYLKDFVLTCRFAENIQEILRQQPVHLLTELDVYSLQDLLLVKNGELLSRLRELMTVCLEHVARCQVCKTGDKHEHLIFFCIKAVRGNVIVYQWIKKQYKFFNYRKQIAHKKSKYVLAFRIANISSQNFDSSRNIVQSQCILAPQQLCASWTSRKFARMKETFQLLSYLSSFNHTERKLDKHVACTNLNIKYIWDINIFCEILSTSPKENPICKYVVCNNLNIKHIRDVNIFDKVCFPTVKAIFLHLKTELK
ncbi:hypothetical protein PR048_030999, partial [Dryococelus australis]